MKIAAANPHSSEEDKKVFVKSAVTMLKSFLAESERNGLGSLKCHSALERGQFLDRVILQNQISQQTSLPRLIEVNTHSNMTLWELKKIAASKLKISPRRIELRRADQTRIALTDQGHAKLLRDFKIESYEILQVQKKAVVF